jgi:hypothetical protein
MADDELARLQAEFPHLAGDDPKVFARAFNAVRDGMTDTELAALEARYHAVEARLARAKRIAASSADAPSWDQVWSAASGRPFESRGYDDPTQLAGLSRWLAPDWDDATAEEDTWTFSRPLTEEHLEVGLHAIAEIAGFFGRPIISIDPSDPAQRPRIGKTLSDLADLTHMLLAWFEASDEDHAG